MTPILHHRDGGVSDGGRNGLAWVGGEWRKKDGLVFGQGSWAGEEWRNKEKKNEREKRRAVAWVDGEWRKRWIGVGQGR